MSTTTPTPPNNPNRSRWERVGSARVRGLGLVIEATGRTFAAAAEDLAGFIYHGEPALVYEIDPAGRQEPREAGHMDLSHSGRMVLIMLDGEAFTGLQMPAADLMAHYRRADRRMVPVVTPPPPSSSCALAGGA